MYISKYKYTQLITQLSTFISLFRTVII